MNNTIQDWLNMKELAEARFRAHQDWLAAQGSSRPKPIPVPTPSGPEAVEYDHKVVWPVLVFMLAVVCFALGVLVGRWIQT